MEKTQIQIAGDIAQMQRRMVQQARENKVIDVSHQMLAEGCSAHDVEQFLTQNIGYLTAVGWKPSRGA